MRAVVVIVTAVIVIAAGTAAWLISRPPSPSPSIAARPVAPAATPAPPRPAPAPTPAELARRSAPRPVEPAAPTPAAAPKMATLRVETDVPDATVLIDRVGVGTAPITVADLAPGQHVVHVSATGYDGFSQTLTLEPGTRTLVVSFREITLDATLAAVHKHGLGSCRGRLTASPEGLRYTADDGKDNVTVTFADLTGFDVDYLQKNLRIRTRQGRTLNFTDPDGNADRLFVFHRDVDKVRKRIASGQ